MHAAAAHQDGEVAAQRGAQERDCGWDAATQSGEQTAHPSMHNSHEPSCSRTPTVSSLRCTPPPRPDLTNVGVLAALQQARLPLEVLLQAGQRLAGGLQEGQAGRVAAGMSRCVHVHVSGNL